MVHMLMNKHSNDNICELLNWDGIDKIVAKGKVVSFDQNEVINDICIGSNAMKVAIDCVNKAVAYLWRPTPSFSQLGEAENRLVAWPTNRVVLQGHLEEDITSKTSSSNNKCKIYDWNEGDVLIVEGRLCSSDFKIIVYCIPLGPLATVVWVHYAKKEDAFLWRSTIDMSCIKEAIGSSMAEIKSCC